MLHFIPAWYHQNTWSENEQKWYMRRMQTEFDDTVKQIQLFHRSGAYPYQILLLSFSPNLRHFLHRQGVFRAPYWSCFDAIQEIRKKKVLPLSYHNMNWPPYTEFIYTQFAIIAMRNGVKYAQIEFGEDGNPIEIDLYEKDKICRRNIYDDRGFVSSTIIYKEEKPVYQDYLMENGAWKLRCFLVDGHVEINPKYPEYRIAYQKQEMFLSFAHLYYNNIEAVIYEVLISYLKMVDAKDLFCVAMHERHVELLQKALYETFNEKKMILSFFSNRYPLEKHPETTNMLTTAGYVIADSRENYRKIQKEAREVFSHIAMIPPYDTRVDLGISQQLSVQKILVPVDGIENDFFVQLIQLLGNYLLRNERAMVHLFTRQADYGRKEQLIRRTCQALKAVKLPEGWAMEKSNEFISENELEMEESVVPRFFVEECVDELSVSKCIREQRVLVDLRKVPEQYLQITALSTGIPQIVCTKTPFVRHKQNGFWLQNIEHLPELLHYYLGSLNHWNDAMIWSYRLCRQYTSDVLIEKWKEVIEIVG